MMCMVVGMRSVEVRGTETLVSAMLFSRLASILSPFPIWASGCWDCRPTSGFFFFFNMGLDNWTVVSLAWQVLLPTKPLTSPHLLIKKEIQVFKWTAFEFSFHCSIGNENWAYFNDKFWVVLDFKNANEQITNLDFFWMVIMPQIEQNYQGVSSIWRIFFWANSSK